MSERSSLLTNRVRRLLGAEPADNETRLIAPLQERLDSIEQRLAELSVQTQQRDASNNDAMATALSGIEKQISRAGREQLKANSLAEAQLDQLRSALEALQAGDERRDKEIAALHEQNHQAQRMARIEVARSMFPALDSLDEAIRSGEQILQRYASPYALTTLFERMRARMQMPQHDSALYDALSSWLTGLAFVRQRMLDILAAEGIQPIAAEGEAFDPQLHMAVEVVPACDDLPPGIVANEIRRGYRIGERVLRHAEVAVSGEASNEAGGHH
ncbi:MAG: nucleotide exchange factor GrpE [Chloroflexales bacterium]|nr:nucleotide exchange factor GrpE [Chloroflexales bacterium]